MGDAPEGTAPEGGDKPPPDKVKEWAVAIVIMVVVAGICWAFMTMLRS